MSYTTVKLSREIKAKLEEYARAREFTLSGAIDRLLEEEEIKEELKEIRRLLKEQSELLEQILRGLKGKELKERDEKDEVFKEVEDFAELPSFVKDNPWLRGSS